MSKVHLLASLLAVVIVMAPCKMFACDGDYGVPLSSFQGIVAYSNGDANDCTGTGSGNYQCVEFVDRFYENEVENPLSGLGDDPGYAYQGFSIWHTSDGLDQYTNGQSTVPPAPGDIYCQSGNTYGHVGIVKSVNLTTMKVVIIDQNRHPSSAELERNLYVDGQGKYSIESIGQSYTTQGWLRDPDYTPTVPSYNIVWQEQFPTYSQGKDYLYLQPNETVACGIKVLNNSNVSIDKTTASPWYVELHSTKTSYAEDSTNALDAPNWLTSTHIVSSNTDCGPGQTTWYYFNIKTPSTPGVYFLYMRLYRPHDSWGFLGPTGWNIKVVVRDPNPVAYDFDGDGISDVWDRTSTGEWHLDYAADNLDGWDWTGYGYGGSQDDPVPADYDGDGRYDLAILKNSDHKWYIDFAYNGFEGWEASYSGYGSAADFPCPCDYDGDGIADISVRDADGDWHIDYSANGFGSWNFTGYGYGGIYDRPAPADYDGDGECDFAVLRNSDRKYLIDYADDGFGEWDVTNLGGYGDFGDYPCPADYDDDGVMDIAVLWTTERTWRVDEADNGFNGWDYTLSGYGGVGDRPMPGDYDGDGWDDIACYHVGDDAICIDYADDNYGEWDWCDGGEWHPTWKPGVDPTLPHTFSVDQNYPNPFNPATTISYSLPEATQVNLDIYNILGQKVATLVDEYQAAGDYRVNWSATGQSSGIYFYRLKVGEAIQSKKMLLLK